MTSALRLFVMAGEPSGDRIGADLVHRLRNRTSVDVSGIGGENLAAVGLNSLFDMNELSVMGWADVLPKLPRLLWRARQVSNAIIKSKPDVAVLVDSQVFSAVVAKRVYRKAPNIPVVLCVAPAVWAWKPERARDLKPHFREIMAVLPFEPEFMRGAGGPETHYIGHPAIQSLSLRNALPASGPLLLLPGSRDGELRRHLPLMVEVATQMANHPRVTGFLLPTPKRLEAKVKEIVSSWPVDVQVVTGEERKSEAMRASVAAVAVTGTVTLELAMAGVPMVTTYVADKGQVKRWLKYKVKYASLPNAILDETLVPEVLQMEADPEPLVAAVRELLDGKAADRQMDGFVRIRRLMEEGTDDDPREDPAERILHVWQA